MSRAHIVLKVDDGGVDRVVQTEPWPWPCGLNKSTNARRVRYRCQALTGSPWPELRGAMVWWDRQGRRITVARFGANGERHVGQGLHVSINPARAALPQMVAQALVQLDFLEEEGIHSDNGARPVMEGLSRPERPRLSRLRKRRKIGCSS